VDSPATHPPAAPPSGQVDGLWFVAAVLWRYRVLLVGVAILSGIAGVALSLVMPKWYSAETRVMLPNSSGSSMNALIETVAPGAGRLLGAGGGGDYTRYLAILTSRSVMERVVERYNLIEHYRTTSKPDPMGQAVKLLGENTTFEVSLEYNHLAIHVLDRNPVRAAQIANTFVDELNSENTRLSSDNAREQRVFVETRLRETEVALDSVRGDLQRLQERYGITIPEAQSEAVLGVIGSATSAIATAEVQYEALRSELGDENPQTVAARVGLETARQQLNQVTAGSTDLLPVPLQQLPQIGRQYAQLQQELFIQAKIMEFVRPMYEQALFDERRVVSAVQVIDEAVPPVRKAKPRRALVAAGIMFSVTLLMGIWIVLRELLRRSAPRIGWRLRQATA